MRILQRQLEKNAEGSLRLQLEAPEDAWHVYNLLASDDRLSATSFRKVATESATGSTTTQKMKMQITISVDDIDYDAIAHTLRVKGRNVEENKFVKMGQYHTIEIGLHRAFKLWKPHWDQIYMSRIETAADPSQSADVAAILLQQGLAHINIISAHMTTMVAKIETVIPKKRSGSSKHDKGIIKFYNHIIEAISRKLRFDVLKCIVVASPAFLKDEFMTYLFEEATKKDIKIILRNRSKFMAVHCSSGHMQSLREVFADPTVISKIANTKAAGESKALDEFFSMLSTTEERAFYGFSHVMKAHSMNAIEKLLVTDNLFRSANVQTRKEYVKLVEEVENSGGEVHIFSSLHQTGQQLNELTGVAALLRFPVHDEHSSDDESD